MPVEIGHGKICYLEIPARDPESSAAFYREVFGWTIRQRSHGEIAFDDGVGEVSGMWVTDRTPTLGGQLGILVHIMVDDAEVTVARILQHGGEITQPLGQQAPEITAHFRDPGGNVLGIYQHRG